MLRNKTIIRNTFFLFAFITHLGLFASEKEQKETWLNIFVHGIIKTPWTLADIIRIMHNCVTDSRYAYATQYVRNSSDYYIFQPMQALGLHQINPESTTSNASNAIACLYNKQLPNANNIYYTFGWLGLLSRYHREDEARNLLKALIEETERLKKINIRPKIRIISFSHGGNVALNIAKSISPDDLPFEINEMILIGSPIQRETDYLINHPIFKKVYNFYSEGDIAQRADFLTSRYGVSRRMFQCRPDCNIPDKLTQVKLRTTKIVYNSCGKVIRKNISDPTHMELWSFGWAQRIYRCKFPLYPLPIAAIIPTIIQKIAALPDCVSKDLLINIIPKQEDIIIKDHVTKQIYHSSFSNSFFNDLKSCALSFKKEYTYKQHIKLVQEALTSSVKRLRKYRKKMSGFDLKYKTPSLKKASYTIKP